MSYLRFPNRALVLLISLVVLISPRLVCAFPLNEVEGKSDEQLAEEDWETREINMNSTETLACGFKSLPISLFWHGYGHYCIGDNESNYKLLTMEGVSLAMIATGLIAGSLTHDDKALSAFWKTFFHFGTTLYISGYIFDVVGTFKGDATQFSSNHLDPFGHTLNVRLKWLPASDLNLAAQIDYVYRSPRFWINPYAYMDFSPLGDWEGGADFGVALWYGERNYTYIAIAMDSKFEDKHSDDYYVLKFLPYVEASIDLGSLFEHMAEFRFVNRIGLGAMLYNYKFADMDAFSDVSTVLMLETELSLNLLKDLNLAFIYRYRPDYVVGQISGPRRLFHTVPVPGVGIFSLDINFNISGGWFANLEMNFGSSIDFWLAVSKHF